MAVATTVASRRRHENAQKRALKMCDGVGWFARPEAREDITEASDSRLSWSLDFQKLDLEDERSEFGGITGGNPLAPYAEVRRDRLSLRSDPTFIPATP